MNFGIPFDTAKFKEGIALNNLKPGIVLTIETLNSIYQATVLDENSHVTLTGGKLRNGEMRFPTPIPATLLGANWGDNFKLGWIGRDMRLAIDVEDHLIATSPVVNVRVEGSGWNYSLDWNKETQT